LNADVVLRDVTLDEPSDACFALFNITSGATYPAHPIKNGT